MAGPGRGRDRRTARARRHRTAGLRTPVWPTRLRPSPVSAFPGPGGTGLVAVPGLGLSVNGWAPTLAALSPSVGSVAVAVPAFGIRAGSGTATDPSASARRLVERLDELGLDRVALAGHSASCQLVAEVAVRHPDRVGALVIVGPTADPVEGSWRTLVRRWCVTVGHERLPQLPMLLRDYAYNGLVTFARTLRAARDHRLDEALASVTCPVLVVRGPDDAISPVAWTERLAASAVDGRAVTLPDGAHMVPLSHPLDLAAEIRRFLHV